MESIEGKEYDNVIHYIRRVWKKGVRNIGWKFYFIMKHAIFFLIASQNYLGNILSMELSVIFIQSEGHFAYAFIW